MNIPPPQIGAKQPGLVILDGPDAVGKTTLAEHLLDGDMTGYVHLDYRPDRELWRLQYFALIKAAWRMSHGGLTVIDRHWPSEQIYSRAYREGTHMAAESRGWDRVMQRLCGVYVICCPSVESAVERHAKSHSGREEMYAPGPQIADVAQRYLDLWRGKSGVTRNDYVLSLTANGGMTNRYDCLRYNIDTEGDNLRAVCQRIFDRISDLKGSQYAPALDYLTPNFLGHAKKADVLFVGERINPKKSGRWPFIDFGASSAALSGVLDLINFDETRGLWTNAHANDRHVMSLLEAAPELKVIALGGEADLYLCGVGVKHNVVYHPSYAKRFCKLDALARQLINAL